jgi:tetratricopeptide (TPR) repeat protein
VNELLIGLVGALVATNQPLAVSNLIQQNTSVSVTMANPNDPGERELQKLMAEDDAAVAEVDKWIQDNNAFAAQGAGESQEALNRRIHARLEPVRKDYEDFLRRYPDLARAHLAYGSFLNDIGEENAAVAQNGKAAQLDPGNPAAWNNLANYYGENGPITNAFVDYAKAIELNPAEPVYYQNLATLVYLYRKDAREFYNLNEPQVFDKALALYRKAVQLIIFHWRLIMPRVTTASGRSAPTTRSWRGRTRFTSPMMTTSAKAFICIWPGSKSPLVISPKPARTWMT